MEVSVVPNHGHCRICALVVPAGQDLCVNCQGVLERSGVLVVTGAGVGKARKASKEV